MDKQALLDSGINAVKSGDFEKGRNLLKQYLSQDNKHVMAWLWYSKSQTTAEKRLECINRALAINPNHPTALKMLDLHIERYGEEEVFQDSSEKSYESYDDSKSKISSESTPEAAPKLGSHIKHSGMNIFEQLVRLFLIGITGGAVTALFIIQESNVAYLQRYIQAALNGESWTWENATWMFPLFLTLAYGFSLYQLFFFVMSFFESLDIYQRGIVHTSFGQKRVWYWRDFKKAKVTNTRVNAVAGFIPFTLTMYSIDLKSDKGNVSINKQYNSYRQIGTFVLEAVSPYAEIKKNV